MSDNNNAETNTDNNTEAKKETQYTFTNVSAKIQKEAHDEIACVANHAYKLHQLGFEDEAQLLKCVVKKMEKGQSFDALFALVKHDNILSPEEIEAGEKEVAVIAEEVKKLRPIDLEELMKSDDEDQSDLQEQFSEFISEIKDHVKVIAKKQGMKVDVFEAIGINDPGGLKDVIESMIKKLRREGR